MIVVDASTLANMLVFADARGRRARVVLAQDTEWAAPEHWMAEVFSVVRGLSLGRKISQRQADRAVDRLPMFGVEPVPLAGLIPRMWQLRANIGGSDAPYVALAERRDLTLVTSDARLAKAATEYCRVELVTANHD